MGSSASLVCKLPARFTPIDSTPLLCDDKITLFSTEVGYYIEIGLSNGYLNECHIPAQELSRKSAIKLTAGYANFDEELVARIEDKQVVVSDHIIPLPKISEWIGTFLSPEILVVKNMDTAIVPIDLRTYQPMQTIKESPSLDSMITFDEVSILYTLPGEIRRLDVKTHAMLDSMICKTPCHLLSKKGCFILVKQEGCLAIIRFPSGELVHKFKGAITGLFAQNRIAIVYPRRFKVYSCDRILYNQELK